MVGARGGDLRGWEKQGEAFAQTNQLPRKKRILASGGTSNSGRMTQLFCVMEKRFFTR
jgi:hypothetical protein